MADIKLQPTDRCVLDYGTTETSLSTTLNRAIILKQEPILSAGEYLYEGSISVLFDGEVTSVTIYKNASSPAAATFSYSISGNTVTFSCRYNTPNDYGSIYSATVNALINYTQTVENKREVFQIKNNSGMILWNKCKSININFDTDMISSIQYDITDGYGGSIEEITESGTYYINTGDRWENIVVHPQDGYAVSSDDLTDAYNAGLLDLTDIANLTLNNFEPLTINITAESSSTLEKPIITHTLLMPTSSTITLHNPNSVAVTYSGTTTLSYSTSSSTVTTWSGTLTAGATTTKAVTFAGNSGSHSLGTIITFTSGAETASDGINDLIVMPASIDSKPWIYLWKKTDADTTIMARINNDNDYAVTVSGRRSEYDRDDEGGDIIMWDEDYSFVIDANSYKDTYVSGGQVNSAYYYGITATFTRGSATSSSVFESVSGDTTATSPDAPTSILDPEECAATITMLEWTDANQEMADWEVEVEWYNPNNYSVLTTVVIYDAASSEKIRVSSIETGANTQGSATLTVNGASQDAITIDVYFNRDNLQSNIVNFEDTLS